MCCEYYSESNLIIHTVGYILLVINSSGNWIIYLAASKKFRNMALEQYRYISKNCFSIVQRKRKVCNSIERNTVQHKPESNARKRKLTTITPFGSGYVSWGTSGAENIHVVVSQQNAKNDKKFQVSVNVK